ncbi:3D domain-containing protein [Selenomonas sp. oral taxon 138]|uniref:3D domain-containing protein n=1 Tax=Selenomonas sp. oral taxon 138 TaxID=712532 RepID=UPI0002A43C99|nr:3D domain-containing protein [Selenomonas sp. oral taxon 138]EKX97579.1 3D domain protein [Selenomonas sp. oral taxon 138 str. F0429]
MKIRKLLLAARKIMQGARRHRELRRFRGALSIGTALAVTAPLALHAPAEAAHILVKEGMRGAAVQHVQELLIRGGYLDGAADGVAGSLTRAAIERCQEKNGLEVDGICGQATYLALSGGVPYDPVALGIREERAHEVSRGSGRSVYVSATGYSAFDPGNGNRTATGTMVRRGVIAVDPSVIPLGTRVFIPGYGEAVAEDIGGSIHGYRIDVAFDSHAEALMFGRQDLEIFIME